MSLVSTRRVVGPRGQGNEEHGQEYEEGEPSGHRWGRLCPRAFGAVNALLTNAKGGRGRPRGRMVRALQPPVWWCFAACSAPPPAVEERTSRTPSLPGTPRRTRDGDAAVPDRGRDASPDRDGRRARTAVAADVAADRPVSMDATAPCCDASLHVQPSAPGVMRRPSRSPSPTRPATCTSGCRWSGPARRSRRGWGHRVVAHTWRWRVTWATSRARTTSRFTADMGTREVATCVRRRRRAGRVRDAGIDGTVTPDAPSGAPPANRFGIGLVGPGAPTTSSGRGQPPRAPAAREAHLRRRPPGDTTGPTAGGRRCARRTRATSSQ